MKNIIIFYFSIFLFFFQARAQSILLPIANNQSVKDVQEHPTGYTILGQTNHNLPSGRSDFMIANTDIYNTFMESSVASIYHPDLNLFSGKLAIGPIEFFDVPVISHYSMAALFSRIDNPAETRALITNIDNLGALVSYIRWTKRNTNFQVTTKPLVISLPGGDYLFIYTYDPGGLSFKVSAARINPVGAIIWEKTYEMQRDRGEIYEMLIINTAKLLANGNIALGGSIRKSLQVGLRPIPFLFVIDQGGRVEWSSSFAKRDESNYSQIVDIAQNRNTPDELMFVGYEEPGFNNTGHSSIHVGKIKIDGTMLYDKYIEFPNVLATAGDFIFPNSADIIESENILGITGLLGKSSLDKLFYLRFNVGTESFDHYNEINENILLGSVIRKSEAGGPHFLIALDKKISSSEGDIKLERIDLTGSDPICNSNSTTINYFTGDLGPQDRKRTRAKNFNNLEPMELLRSYSSHVPVYCSTMAAVSSSKAGHIMTPQKGKINTEIINVYPNPAHSNINIDAGSHKIKEISILDLHGRVVKKISGNAVSNLNIPIFNMTPGLYTIWMNTDQGRTNKKLIIQ